MANGSTYPPPGYAPEGLSLRPIWTPFGFQARGQVFQVACRHCGHTAPLPLAELIEAGRGDRSMWEIVPALVCSICGSRHHHGYEVSPCREG